MLAHPITADPVFEFAADVRAGLMRPGQKELPSKYLYDNLGSALFEAISILPEYGLTRADERLLRRRRSAPHRRHPMRHPRRGISPHRPPPALNVGAGSL